MKNNCIGMFLVHILFNTLLFNMFKKNRSKVIGREVSIYFDIGVIAINW